jgi:hypothetical protein
LQKPFESVVVEKLNSLFGAPSRWRATNKVVGRVKEAYFWERWINQGFDEDKMMNLIIRLKTRCSDENAKVAAVGAASSDTTPTL